MNKNKVLIISEGPPPLGSTGVEGGGLRAWGLAKGLARHGFKVTLAYRSTFVLADDSKNTSLPPNLSIATWNGADIDDILNEHKIIVMRYAMGEALHIVKKLRNDHILVTDNYIPISVEVAARRSEHPDENVNFLRLQRSSQEATRRADYILYASESQRNYYVGYLAGINKLNPTTYDELPKRMFCIPYGVDPEEKPESTPPVPDHPTLLWYGAFYSWFDMEGLIKSLMILKKELPGFRLIIAGAKNPYNKDPGILAHYEKTMKKLEPLNDVIELVPWGAFDERFDTYAKGSAIITWNHEGLENEYAWRTRLMDFILAERPIITNGGDPLGEDLIEKGIAFRSSTDTIKETFLNILTNPPKKTEYRNVAKDYSWYTLTEQLAKHLDHATRMPSVSMNIKPDLARNFKENSKLIMKSPYIVSRSVVRHGLKGTVWRLARKLRLVKE